MKLKIAILLILSVINCKAQGFPKKEPMDTFGIEIFENNKHLELKQYDFYNDKGDFVHQSESRDYYSEKIQKNNSKYSISKVFYKSGRLKGKGLLYNNFFVGEWVSYNEKGKITEIKNYDQLFSFSLEDVLNYSHVAFVVGKNSKKKKYIYLGGNQGSGYQELKKSNMVV